MDLCAFRRGLQQPLCGPDERGNRVSAALDSRCRSPAADQHCCTGALVTAWSTTTALQGRGKIGIEPFSEEKGEDESGSKTHHSLFFTTRLL